jgi:hypothetical protein
MHYLINSLNTYPLNENWKKERKQHNKTNVNTKFLPDRRTHNTKTNNKKKKKTPTCTPTNKKKKEKG